jgi:hypothetical protein
MTSLLLVTVLAVAYSPAPGPVPAVKPVGPPPTMSVAKVEGERLTLTRTRVVIEFVTETIVVQEGNKTITRQVMVPVQKLVPEVTTRDLKVVRGFDTANKPLDANKLAERLKTATPVFLSADGQPIDETFRKALKDDGILLIVPEGEPVPAVPK